MRFIFVRHGEVEDPRPALEAIGHDDAVLSAYGRRQAAALAHGLMGAVERGESIEALYTSPLRSARTTAEALSAVLDLEARVASELTTLTPEVLPPGDYSAVERLQAQAWDAVQALKEQFEQQSTVVLVTHELPIRALVCRALEMAIEDMFRFELEPASLTTIEFRLQRDGRERTLLASLNDMCHVEAV